MIQEQKIKRLELLKAVKDAGVPVGALYLADVLKIPQATVGRALRKAEEENLVQQVGNKGRVLTDGGLTYISRQEAIRMKKKTANNLLDLVESNSKDKLREVVQARKVLELFTVSEACKNANEKDLADLDNVMLEYIHEVRYGGSGKEQDLQTHLLIAKMAGNSMIYQMLKLILTEDDAYSYFSSTADKVGSRSLCITQHDQIVQAIKERNSDEAKAAMERHLDKVIGDIERL